MKMIWVVLMVLGFAQTSAIAEGFSHTVTNEKKPWTADAFEGDVQKFTFAIHADLTGGERPQVFEIAMAQLALLGPEFVISVGDLIEGGGTRDELIAQWQSFDQRAAKVGVPMFYVGGNHDLSSALERDVWADRYGPHYYHFRYKDVLFLVLDTEDLSETRRDTIAAQRAEAVEIYKTDGPEAFAKTPYAKSQERVTGAISDQQGAYFVDAIAQNKDVRHVFVFTHKPAWNADETRFHDIEAALADIPYTVFNGHEHFYKHQSRFGRDYIQLATTGGKQFPELGMSEDHVVLVTVAGTEVSIATLMLAGIRDRTGHIPLDGEGVCFAVGSCK